VYLAVSLFSSFSAITKTHVIAGCNLVGVMCLADLFVVNKNDMVLHHAFALAMIHYMNRHHDIPLREEIAMDIMKMEISTIFLTLNNIIRRTGFERVKKINQLVFATAFFYYRVFNYGWRFFKDDTFRSSSSGYSHNWFYWCEINVSVYGMFLLNLYWCSLILKQVVRPKLEKTCAA
jgi:hypothetical protein